jgi:hypothetical protein
LEDCEALLATLLIIADFIPATSSSPYHFLKYNQPCGKLFIALRKQRAQATRTDHFPSGANAGVLIKWRRE